MGLIRLGPTPHPPISFSLSPQFARADQLANQPISCILLEAEDVAGRSVAAKICCESRLHAEHDQRTRTASPPPSSNMQEAGDATTISSAPFAMCDWQCTPDSLLGRGFGRLAPANWKLFVWLAINNREVWTLVLQGLSQIVLPPDPDSRLNSWWCRAANALPKEGRKGFNSLVILVYWELWKHRNACMFEKIRPDAQIVFQLVVAKGHLWCLAGASALQNLFLELPAVGKAAEDVQIPLEIGEDLKHGEVKAVVAAWDRPRQIVAPKIQLLKRGHID
ncbi:hypothetical protein U9M48_030458 [Paspalum notatum var. saurae]|uniref:Uncharacterized protein n=1 Tax=Paspalum notatum var. saurae TaxID=547442 RepID=A0AAQ3U0R4_PASNO